MRTENALARRRTLSMLEDDMKRYVDVVFEILIASLAITLAFLCMFTDPMCKALANTTRGCGVSLDDALSFTLAHGGFNNETGKADWGNPGYIADKERLKRRWFLLGMNLMEADLGRRMTVAILAGGIIGFERRAADRPAGIRTMCLASLGSALFTIAGTFAFLSGPQGWDASRISAAIPGGTGFLGAGIIWKGVIPGDTSHKVRGLTTAASVWISAAAGTAAGGGLYFSAIYGAIMAVVLLRYGPRLYGHPDNTENDSDDDDESTEPEELSRAIEPEGISARESSTLLGGRSETYGTTTAPSSLDRSRSFLRRKKSRAVLDPSL